MLCWWRRCCDWFLQQCAWFSRHFEDLHPPAEAVKPSRRVLRYRALIDPVTHKASDETERHFTPAERRREKHTARRPIASRERRVPSEADGPRNVSGERCQTVDFNADGIGRRDRS